MSTKKYLISKMAHITTHTGKEISKDLSHGEKQM